MALRNSIINAIRRVAKRVSKDKYLLSGENDFTIMLYNELIKDRRIKRLVINTEYNLDGKHKADMIIYDRKQRKKLKKYYRQIQDYEVKHFNAILEFKISWGRSKKNKIKVSREDINKLRRYKNKADNLYYLLMEIYEKDDFNKEDLLKIKNVTFIYSNPISNKFFLSN